MKVVELYAQTPKQFEPDPNPQNSKFWPPKSKKQPINWIKLKAKIEGDMENIYCFAT